MVAFHSCSPLSLNYFRIFSAEDCFHATGSGHSVKKEKNQAKNMAEAAGSKILTQVGKEAANDAKEKLEAAGAVIELE